MKGITVTYERFKEMMDMLTPCVGKDESRIVLTLIHMEVKNSEITAVSCDGYRIAVTQLPCVTTDIGYYDEFVFHIRPLKVPKCFSVEVQIADDKTSAEITFHGTKNGDETVKQTIPGGQFIEWRRVIPDIDPPEYEISFDPAYLADICKVFKGHKEITFRFSGKTKLALVTSGREEYYNRNTFAGLLPMRTLY